MARPYAPGPKHFTFGAGDGDELRQVVVADPQEAYVEFSAYFRGRDAATYTITDEATGEGLVLMPGRGVVSRVERADAPRIDHLLAGGGNRYLPSAMLFFENGHAGLDHFGQWFADIADLDASPETRGAVRAATITTEAGAIAEVCRIWADSGIVDPSDQYYVFFDSCGADEERAERAAVLALIAFLGLERVDTPAGAADGEVWVRTDPRIDAELEQWS